MITAEATEIDEQYTSRPPDELCRILLENSFQGLAILQNSRFVFCSSRFAELTGYSREELLSLSPAETAAMVYCDDRAAVKEFCRDLLAAAQPVVSSQKCRVRRKDGTLIRLELYGKKIEYAGMSALHLTLVDLTESEKTIEKLQLALDWHEAIFEGSRDAIMISNTNYRIIDANGPASQLTGYSKEELTGMRVEALNPNVDPRVLDALRAKILAGQTILGDTKIVRKDGLEIDVEFGHQRVIISGVPYIHSIARDITSRKCLEAQLARAQQLEQERVRQLAFYDALTGLPNRILMKERLQQALSEAKRSNARIAVMLLDLNRFKNVNDSLGHNAGDRLLQEAALRLQGVLRESDTLARMGGDEFVIILPECGQPEDAIAVCERIHQCLDSAFVIDRHKIHISTSIGISLFPADGRNADELLKGADTAMYACKRRSSARYRFFTSEMNTRIDRHLRVERELRHALAHDELVLHFQPQLNPDAGIIVGVEALLRWRHPVRGVVPPGDFIHIAEESNLIVEIGKWALHEACRWNARRIEDCGQPRCPVAVNIAAAHIRLPDFRDHVFHALDDSGLPPDLLEIELTESAFLQDTDCVNETLAQLKRCGVRFSIDDFGTGYSCLSYLRRFHIERLKIDQSFVRDLPDSADCAAIVSAIIGMAKSLGLEVLAEGVETQAQMDFLREHGCTAVQGFLFGRPLAGDAFIASWRKPRPRISGTITGGPEQAVGAGRRRVLP